MEEKCMFWDTCVVATETKAKCMDAQSSMRAHYIDKAG
jgi:hypothetical protein